jgi:hypothetical protein
MHIDFAYACTFRSRQHGQRAPFRRGHAVIDDGDGHEFQYRVQGYERAAFKAWARATFTNHGESRLAGRWPNYTVDRRN